jgi:formate hydrogenlyase transcriptional activator
MSVADLWERVRSAHSYWLHTLPARYGFAVLAVAVATALQFGLRWWGPFHLAFILFYPAVVVVAMQAGFGPGILATVLSATSGRYFFLGPRNSFVVRTPEDLVGPTLFAFIGVSLTLLTYSRNRAKQALRVSEAELNHAQAVAHIGSWHWDIKRNVLKLSDEAYCTLGLPVNANLSPQQAQQIIHPEDRERSESAWNTALSRGRYDEEIRALVAGRSRWVRVQGSVECDADGWPARAVGTVQDITERKSADARLQEFERVVEGLDEMIVVVDRDYRYVIANSAFLKYRGSKREEVVGHLISEIVRPEAQKTVKAKVDECFQGKVVQYDLRYRYPTLGERDLSIIYYPIDGPKGVDRVACVMQDVTEQKQADQSLRLFRALIDQSNDAVDVVDPDTLRFLDINEKACKERGYTREEMLSMTVFDISPEVDETHHAKVRATVRDSGYATFQVNHRRKDGSMFPVEVSLRCVQLDRSYVIAVCRDISDRNKVESALRESEDRYRDLVEHSEDLVCTHDLEGNLLTVNPAPARILGYSVEELLKIPMRELIVPEGRELFDAYLERLKTTGQPESGLLCVITKSGEIRTWDYHNTLRTEGVEAPIVRGMAHDITEQRRAELALRHSEKRYRMLFEKTVAGVATIGLDGQVIDCNDAWARMFGYRNAAECHGSQVAERYPDPAYREVLMSELKQSGFFLNRELELLRNDGTPFSVLLSSVLLTEGQSPPLIQSTIFDVTARQQAEDALRKSEEHFRILVEQASDGIFIADAQGKYIDVNSAGAEMLGYTREEILQLSIADIVVAEEIPRVAAEVARLEGGDIIRSEWMFRRKDGSFFPGEVCGKQLPDGRLQGILRDMTERNRAEEILRHSEERFRVALKDSAVTVFNQDRNMRYTWVYNPPPEWPAEVVGKTSDEVLGAKNAARLNDLMRRVLQTGKGLRAELTFARNGHHKAFDVNLEPLLDSAGAMVGITGSLMDVARLRELADRLEEQKDKLAREKSYLEGEIEAELGFEEIIGQSPALLDVLKKARVVAPTDSNVLLLGETGTGKELVARAVHSLSSRHDKSFIKLNCAAVPSGLLESELFGHEKGAFTSAVSQKVGRLELADGGTLFLDEIGELPLELQPKLLRVLQDREFERLGGVRTLRVDVRIISATNRDLHKDVSEKRFREDLFYRLNVFPIQLPALRERKSDIPMLVSHFVRKYAARMGRHIEIIPSDAMNVLRNWGWPGNVRELENMIERMVILSKGQTLAPPPVELEAEQDFAEDRLEEMEREHILRVLRETHGVLSGAEGAASRLGVKRTTLQSMLKRFGIEPHEYRRGTGTFGSE